MEPTADPALAETGGAQPQTLPPAFESVRDSIGRLFDPAKFRLDDDGRPKLDSMKRFCPLKGGRNRADGSPAQPRNGQKLPEPAAADFSDVDRAAAGAPAPGEARAGGVIPGGGQVGDQYTAAAAATVSMVATAAILVMGAHVKPDSAQVTAMVESYADCYRAYGYAPKTPPWLGPVIATGAWIGPHLRTQETQTNLQRFKAKVLGFLGAFRGRRDARAAAAVSSEVEQRAA